MRFALGAACSCLLIAACRPCFLFLRENAARYLTLHGAVSIPYCYDGRAVLALHPQPSRHARSAAGDSSCSHVRSQNFSRGVGAFPPCRSPPAMRC